VAEPRTICFYINFFESYTGGPQVVRNLVEKLDRNRFRPVVITNRTSPLTDDLAKMDVEFVVVAPRGSLAETGGKSIAGATRRFKNSIRALGYNWSLLRILRKHNCQLVWARNIKGVLLVGIASKLLRIPLIWDIGMEKQSIGAVQRLHRIGFRLADCVVTEGNCVAPSVFSQATLARFGHRIRVIKSGIPDDRVSQIYQARQERPDLDAGQSSPPVRIVNIASVCDRKNQRLLLQAVLPLLRKYPQVQLDFIGPIVEPPYEQALRAMVSEASLESRVRFLGWRSDALSLLASAHIFALSSKIEGVPYSILEAMYANVPIISTTCGGVPDVIADRQTGLLVPEYDPAAYRQLLDELIGDAQLRRNLAAAAHDFVLNNHTAEAWSRHYMRLFEDVLDRKQNDRKSASLPETSAPHQQ